MAADEQGWRDRSMCRDLDPDEIEEKFWPHPNSDGADAKKICKVCPVAAECLKYALDTKQEFGVWGAMTERERAQVLSRASGKAAPSDSPRCGTYSGATRHRKLKESMCPPCRRAATAYEAARRAARREGMSA